MVWGAAVNAPIKIAAAILVIIIRQCYRPRASDATATMTFDDHRDATSRVPTKMSIFVALDVIA